MRTVYAGIATVQLRVPNENTVLVVRTDVVPDPRYASRDAVCPHSARQDPPRFAPLTDGHADRAARATASAQRVGALASAASAPHLAGSPPLGVAVAYVDELANCTRHRETRNRHRLASARLSAVLEVEESSPNRAT